MRQLRNAAFGVAEQRLPMLVDQLSRTDPGRVDTRVTAHPDHHHGRDRRSRPRLRPGPPRGRTTGRRAGPAPWKHQRDLHQPVAPQPVADRGPADPHHRPGEQRGRPGPAGEPLPPGPPRDPYAPQRREPPGPRRRGAGPPLGPAGPAGRRAARRLLRGGAVRAHRAVRRPGGRDPRPRRDRPRAPARRAPGERHHVLLAADQGPRHRDPSPRRPHHGRDPRQGHRPHRRGLRGHQPQAGQPADRGRRDLAAHGPVRGRPAVRPARHPRPAAPLGRAGRYDLARHAPRHHHARWWRRAGTAARRVHRLADHPGAAAASAARSSRAAASSRCVRPRSWASTTAATPRSRTTYASWTPWAAR